MPGRVSRSGRARRLRAISLLLLLPALGPACREGGERPAGAAAGPNLLLVTIDTLRADVLGCYGGEPDVGREICALADAGTQFEWAIAAAPYTAPSIASILTSTYPAEHGVSQSALSFLAADALSVAEVLREAGYTTAAFVCNPVLERGRSLDQGFAIYDQDMPRSERNRPGFRERDARQATDAALAWARVGAREPWFLWMHYQDPHGPYAAPTAGTPADAAGAERLPVLEDHSGRGGIPAYQQLPGVYSREAYTRAYLDEVRFVDAELGRLLRGLDSLGSPPAVLLTSDHGEALGEDDYWFAHGHSLGLDQIRVPLLWRPARPGPPTRVDAPVSLLDVAPTLLSVAGLELPADFDGVPLPPAGGSRPAAGRPLFADHEVRAAVVVGPLYYARDRRAIGRGEIDPTSGGLRLPLPARTARLDAAAPRYSSGADEPAAEALEPLLVEYLTAARQRSGPRRDSAPPELEERLRALGYLD